MEVVTVGGQVRLVTVSRGIPGVTAFVMAEGVGMQLTGQLGLSPALSATAEPELTFVSTSAGTALLTTGLATLAPYSHWLTASGSFATPSYWGDADTAGVHLAEAAAVQTGAGQVLFASRYDAPGLWSFEITASGAAVAIESLPAINGAPAAVISDIAVLAGGGTQWLVTALADQDRLVAYAINSDGTTGAQQSIGAPDGLGISVPTALATITMGQVEYLLLASAQSSTLTVFRLDQNGVLVAVDNVVDSLHTRFASASQVEAISTHGRAFVVAAGSDDGLSLFTILPGGRLLLLATYSDNAVTTLANVSSLAVAVLGQELQIVAASGSEPGLTQFVFDLSRVGLTLVAGPRDATLAGTALDDILAGGSGNDVLSGGGGDDILVDDLGSDSLTGGAGSDVFVFTADGQRDVVLDFTPGVDRLDLSGFGLLYSVEQLTITPTAWGAMLEYDGEFIEIHTSSGQTLLASDFTAAGILNLTRSPGETQVTSPKLYGTEHADVVTGGTRGEFIFGYGGADTINGRGGQDVIYGGLSDDWLDGGHGSDLVYGESGIDRLYGSAGNDTLDGGSMADTLSGGADDDTLLGRAGNDLLFGDDGNDSLDGGGGSDRLEGGAGIDTLRGGSGFDTLFGDAADDFLYGAQGNDSIDGGDGDDRAFGGAHVDTMTGGLGNDSLNGDGGTDMIQGDAGLDRLVGGVGADTILGGADNDRIFGGGDADWIEGGTGDDISNGGTGADEFVFATGDGFDRIMDFEDGIDLIRITSGAADFGDVTVTAQGLNTLVTFSDMSVLLIAIISGKIDANDFVFG